MAYYRRINVLTKSFGYVAKTLSLAFIIAIIFIINSIAFASTTEQKRSVYKYFSGTNQEVSVYTIKGETPGPTLLIFAGIHGDERACPIVAAKYSNIKLEKGNLIVVPRLNTVANQRKKRQGLGGDMNRLFSLPENSKNPDIKVVNLAKSLIKNADYVVNLHQGDGFYSPTWVNNKRNPRKWGQSNVIDAPNFDLPNGEKLELEKFAQRVAEKSNAKIKDKRYHFQVNNTNADREDSIHKEQRKSLTYYAVTKEHKIAIALEVTKNCSSAQATNFMITAMNAIVEETGIVAEKLPSGPKKN